MTPKKRLFAKHYLVSHNASDAARKAGYSKRTAASQGQRLLKDVDVSKAVASHAEKVGEELLVDAKRVLKNVLEIANYRPRDDEASHKDVLRANEMLMRHLGLLNADESQKGGGAVTVVINSCARK